MTEDEEGYEDIKISEFFSNYNYGPIAICTKEAPKEYHYKNLINEGYVPISYVPKEKMDMDNQTMLQILNQAPDTVGILVCMGFYNTYY